MSYDFWKETLLLNEFYWRDEPRKTGAVCFCHTWEKAEISTDVSKSELLPPKQKQLDKQHHKPEE